MLRARRVSRRVRHAAIRSVKVRRPVAARAAGSATSLRQALDGLCPGFNNVQETADDVDCDIPQLTSPIGERRQSVHPFVLLRIALVVVHRVVVHRWLRCIRPPVRRVRGIERARIPLWTTGSRGRSRRRLIQLRRGQVGIESARSAVLIASRLRQSFEAGWRKRLSGWSAGFGFGFGARGLVVARFGKGSTGAAGKAIRNRRVSAADARVEIGPMSVVARAEVRRFALQVE